MEEERGTLKIGEFHPMASNAYKYLSSIPLPNLFVYLESLSSCAIENNRLAEICAETLRRVLYHEPVSDRYLLGLAWFIKEAEEAKNGKAIS